MRDKNLLVVIILEEAIDSEIIEINFYRYEKSYTNMNELGHNSKLNVIHKL